MDIPSILILAAIFVVVLPLLALIAGHGAKRRADEADSRAWQALRAIESLRAQIAALEGRLQVEEEVASPGEKDATPAVTSPPPALATPVPPGQGPPPLPLARPAAIASTPSPIPEIPEIPAIPEVPAPPVPLAALEKPSGPKVPPPAPKLDLERFLGVKLFAWLGGLALFFAIIFFVKYSFERNLIPPAGRVAIGFALGIGLLVAGLVTHRRKAYTVLAQTFLASGVLILYGVSYAGHVRYRIFGPAEVSAVVTFGLMAVTTTVAFGLAVRLRAQVVAVLGMVGGFLTPVLCSTGRDAPIPLFGYVAMLDVGLLLVAGRRQWPHLVPLAAAGTVALGWGWFARFFRVGHYAEGAATFLPMGIVLFFAALFAGAAWRERGKGADRFVFGSAAATVVAAVAAGFYFVSFQSIADRPALLHGFMLLAGVLSVFVSFTRSAINGFSVLVALLGFAHGIVWARVALTEANLPVALGVVLAFGGVHVALPLVLRRWLVGRGETVVLPRGLPWVGPLMVGLLVMPAALLPGDAVALWPALMVANLALVGFALATRARGPLALGLVMSMAIGLVWLDRLPRDWTVPLSFFGVVGAFGGLLTAATFWLGQRLGGGGEENRERAVGTMPAASFLPALPALLPFLLLLAVMDKLGPLPQGPIFATAAGLAVLLLALARWGGVPVLCAVALGCVAAVETVWHFRSFDAGQPWGPLLWYGGICLGFTVYPFVFRRAFDRQLVPWGVAAASGVVHFLPVYAVVKAAFPAFEGRMGWIPAFFALPPALGLALLVKKVRSAESIRTGQLAWFGGVLLLFITLIFPIQFERQWLTVAWAMEGAALLWLHRRVVHQGLVWTGLALLAAAFLRLVLNPAVIFSYPRTALPVWNWHLYSYGIAAASFMLGAWWLRRPDPTFIRRTQQAVLWAGGGILLFALLNIEIADFFTNPGERVIVLFSATPNLARDMTTTMAWGLFALALIVIGLRVRSRGARRAGVGLLGVTLLKLFLRDLAELETFYRIAALAVVAVIALAASFLYQRHFDRDADG